MTSPGHGVISAAETGRTNGERGKIDRRTDGWMDGRPAAAARARCPIVDVDDDDGCCVQYRPRWTYEKFVDATRVTDTDTHYTEVDANAKNKMTEVAS